MSSWALRIRTQWLPITCKADVQRVSYFTWSDLTSLLSRVLLIFQPHWLFFCSADMPTSFPLWCSQVMVLLFAKLIFRSGDDYLLFYYHPVLYPDARSSLCEPKPPSHNMSLTEQHPNPFFHSSICLHITHLVLPVCFKLPEDKDSILFQNVSLVGRVRSDT